MESRSRLYAERLSALPDSLGAGRSIPVQIQRDPGCFLGKRHSLGRLFDLLKPFPDGVTLEELRRPTPNHRSPLARLTPRTRFTFIGRTIECSARFPPNPFPSFLVRVRTILFAREGTCR